MHTSWQTASCFVFLLILTSVTSYVWEGKRMVKPVYFHRTPQALYASTGYRPSAGITYPQTHRSDTLRQAYNFRRLFSPSTQWLPIPPSFVTGAQVHALHSPLAPHFLTKPKRWAISTKYDSQLEDSPKEETAATEEKTDETVANETYNPEPNVDEPASSVPQLIPETDAEGKNDSPIGQTDDRITQKYFPSVSTSVEQPPFEMESYKLVLEAENFEPMRPVYRSPSPWPQRDLNRLGEPRHPVCSLPLDRGAGPDDISSWYYDVYEKRCRWFGYRGHGGNANRFYSRIACEAYCIVDLQELCDAVTCSWKGTKCTLVADEKCRDMEQAYGRDWRLKCPPDHPVCLSRRNTRIAPDVSFKPIPPECFQPEDGGSCQRKNPAVNYYYDRERNACMTFYYHNCGGNDNRFETKSDCMTHCSP